MWNKFKLRDTHDQDYPTRNDGVVEEIPMFTNAIVASVEGDLMAMWLGSVTKGPST